MKNLLSATEHICNEARRSFQEEIPDVNFIFISYESGHFLKALNEKKMAFMENEILEDFFDELRRTYTNKHLNTEVIGIVPCKKKSWLPLLAGKEYIAVCSVNMSSLLTQDDAKYAVYRLAWQATQFIEDLKQKSFYDFEKKGKVFYTKLSRRKTALHNLLGDVFAATYIEATENKKAIRPLRDYRAQHLFEQKLGHKAELFPYPLVAEATEELFKELKDTLPPKNKLISFASGMAQDVLEIYEETTVGEWLAFSIPIQQMVWCGHDPKKVLSLALYTSEDPYARAAAHAVSDILGEMPDPVQDTNIYNPFTELEVNQRHHDKICKMRFEGLFNKYKSAKTPEIFMEAAALQIDPLKEGDITGFCAPALLKVYHSAQEPEHTQLSENKMQNILFMHFEEERTHLPLTELVEVMTGIITLKRSGRKDPLTALLRLKNKEKPVQIIAETIETLASIYKKEKAPEQEPSQTQPYPENYSVLNK